LGFVISTKFIFSEKVNILSEKIYINFGT